MAKLFLIGDSITAGAWDSRGGWANRLIGRIMVKTIEAQQENQPFYCLPYNLGVSGDMVSDVIERLGSEIKQRRDCENPNEKIEILFSIGVNDSIYMVTDNHPRVSDTDFLNNLESLIKKSRACAQKISFTGLLPVDEPILNPIPWAPDKAYISDRVKRFDSMIEETCVKHAVPFLPLYKEWSSVPDYASLLIDGVHPNEKGHALLAKQIGKFLINDSFLEFHSL